VEGGGFASLVEGGKKGEELGVAAIAADLLKR
jgi:hypothetical protein